MVDGRLSLRDFSHGFDYDYEHDYDYDDSPGAPREVPTFRAA